MFYKSIAALLVATSFSVVASAQPITDSDVSSILDNYGSSFNALASNVCLDLNRQAVTGSTLKEAFTVKQNEVVGLLNRGDRTMAAGKASTLLGAFGHCYSVSDKQIDRPTYAGFMGGFMATEALAYGDNDKMAKAITLLDYAKSHGQTNTQFLNLVKDHRAPELDTGNTEKTSLSTLISGVETNALRFKRDYEGKTVTFDAKVESVSYESLVKKTSLSLKTLTGNNFSGCYLTGAMEDKAIDLNKGQTVTVTANVTVYESILGSSLSLKNCQF